MVININYLFYDFWVLRVLLRRIELTIIMLYILYLMREVYIKY